MKDRDGEQRADANRARPETYGDQVRAGVARAAFLERLLREPRVITALDDLASITVETNVDKAVDPSVDPFARALAVAARTIRTRVLERDRMGALAQELGLAPLGRWLPEFLASAARFRRELEDEDLRTCTLVDPRLRVARANVRLWRGDDARPSSEPPAPVLRLLAALVPATEPTDWESRTPDWIELFTILVEHAAERLDWTREATGPDRLWPYQLHSSFVSDVEPGDDPEVLHGLVGLWANGCHTSIDAHTRPRPPRGRVPGSSGFCADGRPREGERDKIRRWVGWYTDREVGHVAHNDILRTAFPNSAAPLERSSEVRRHIREAERCLALELPLDAGQAVRLWKLAQAYRDLLEVLPPRGGETF
ncbi:MAG TPA: hypothetical protein VLM76_13140 [Patescibacteria group bacterium]|nr:hypothetical protein [Patescibacteria group bacterium]